MFARSINVQEVAKLGSNENPYGTSPKVLAAIVEAVPKVSLYPDPFCNDLRDVLSRASECRSRTLRLRQRFG